MIRIRPGRSWRHNPGYVGKLRRLEGPHLHGFEGSGILDVLGIEVDGVDIAAGVGEAEILVAMDELCRALSRLSEGSPAAQATVGRGPTELVLEARGPDVLLTLVSLAPAARLLASGLLLDGERLRRAALSAARALADDLLAISPALSGSALLERLRRPLRAPSRHGQRAMSAPAWPRPVPGRGFVARGLAQGVRCEVQVPEETAWRLAGRSEVADAPLAALLGSGSLVLRVSGAPALSWEMPPYLALRDLVRSASALCTAWEAADRECTVRFGAAELHCDLTRDEVRASGWRASAPLAPSALAVALAGAARAYATKALDLTGEAEELSDLRDSARRIEEHCKDLVSGDFRPGRSAAAVPPPRKPKGRQAPLSRGRVRRLVYREAWRTGPGEPADSLLFCGGVLVGGSRGEVRALDLATGRESFRSECEAFAQAAHGDDLFVTARAALSRVDPSNGERRWQRRVRASSRLWPIEGGVIVPADDGVSCVSDVGSVAFEAKLPFGKPESCAAAQGILVLAARDHLFALDAADGRLLWKRKVFAPVLALSVLARRAIAIAGNPKGTARLVAYSPESGKLLWARPLPGPPEGGIETAFECAVVACGAAVVAARLSDGTLSFEAKLPFAADLHLAVADEDDGRGALLLATSAGGACARIGDRGSLAWSLPAEGSSPPAPARLARRLALVARDVPVVLDAQEGFALARIGERAPRCAALADDASVALCDEAGAISLERLATHLSIVTS
ncbi:MAG: PQQ-binding-like beta-propeller repeat protein [Myxococcales bacterium]